MLSIRQILVKSRVNSKIKSYRYDTHHIWVSSTLRKGVYIFITRSNKDDCLQIIHPKHNYVQSSASYPRGLLQAFQSGKLLDKCLEKKVPTIVVQNLTLRISNSNRLCLRISSILITSKVPYHYLESTLLPFPSLFPGMSTSSSHSFGKVYTGLP